MQHIWGLVKIFKRMQQEGLIENFDFGKALIPTPFGPKKDQPKELEDTVAIFLTTPPGVKEEEIMSKIVGLKEEEGIGVLPK